jgi:hypothetical protein
VADQKPFSIRIFGNAEDCRTEAEINFAGSEIDPALVLYEDRIGWHVVSYDPVIAAKLSDPIVEAAINTGKERLLSFPNRQGLNPPENLSGAGLSLWLMREAE